MPAWTPVVAMASNADASKMRAARKLRSEGSIELAFLALRGRRRRYGGCAFGRDSTRGVRSLLGGADCPGNCGGTIGFRSGRAGQLTRHEREPWPGVAQPRDTSGDALVIGPGVVSAGLFDDERQIRTVTAHLTAGVSPQEVLAHRWSHDRRPGLLSMSSHSSAGAKVEREFYRNKGAWVADHVAFELPAELRGGGHARRMMRASLQSYDSMNVDRIEVDAGQSDGGYVWAKAGFVAADPRSVRQTLTRLSSGLEASAFAAVQSVVLKNSDEDLMRDLADLSVPMCPRLGSDLLRGSNWLGFVDLSNPSHRSRLAEALRR